MGGNGMNNIKMKQDADNLCSTCYHCKYMVLAGKPVPYCQDCNSMFKDNFTDIPSCDNYKDR